MSDRPDPQIPAPQPDGRPPQPYQAPQQTPTGWTQTQAGWTAEQQGQGQPNWSGQPQQGPGGGGQAGWIPGNQGYPQQGHQPQGYPPAGYPPQAPRSKAGWFIGGGAVLALALAGVLVWQFTAPKDDPGPATLAGLDASSQHSPETIASITPCSTPPKMTGTVATASSSGLTVSATLTSSCPDGDIVANNDFQVAVTSGGKDVAAGSFDLSSTPIVLSKGQSAKVNLVFPAGSYWRTADMVSGPLTLAGTPNGSSSPTPDGTGSNPNTLQASGPGVPTSGSADAAALAALKDISATDTATMRSSLQGKWLPQISSKQVGLVADGIRWTNTEILREFLDNKARHPEAMLLWSGDWSSFDLSDFWVTVVGTPKSSGESALAWCVSNGLNQEHCLAKIVTNTGGSKGTTMQQPR